MNNKDMCKGPNEKLAALHADNARKYDVLAKFYTLAREDQLIFMAMFDQMVENNRNAKDVQKIPGG